ncbi:Flp pilus assembly complex ATPase component TadA [Halorubellus sp. JP-L1]|uniref:PINc/VapC family ATPase n=1 Tax=Halorubellus sp. JP-L1 TaxID=2715753 RepID=UPI00140A1208|nr:PINc/VapC family ATPase [Halorubellus sp. JP-L1]NHN42436.1 Flp pilus assembly complex ATPase component TadA [Halorubellus sp. JP-L1]
MNVVPDTSVVVDGRVSAKVDDGTYEGATVMVPEAVVAELEAQANAGHDTGWAGLEELQRLAERADDDVINLKYVGERPDDVAIDAASEGEIDALIREIAEDRGATFLTSDVVQGQVATAKGIDVDVVSPEVEELGTLAIENYFDDDTMSVHLKAGAVPKAKRGEIGDMHYVPVADDPLDEATMDEYANEVVNAAKEESDGFLELSKTGMDIVQFRDYRIAVARPPFADGIEITAVRPIALTTIEDYEFADELTDRLLERQRGVLISGSPGAGKSTFAQAVANYLAEHDFSVKTMEKPRDLQVGPDITQYTELDGSMANTADSLLMVRPDYTIYDEVRKTDDFEVFADMRLAGVGMVGVVHATRAIDALQRLVGRVELGMIPQVVDTVVYIEAGEVDTVYDVKTEVKVPHGLTEEDLARPVITINEFESGEPKYEIYTFNRQVVTVPLEDAGESSDSGVDRIAKQEIEREIRSIARGHVSVQLKGQNTAVVYVDDDDISSVIGKGGGRIQDVENRLGIDIDVRTHDENPHYETGGSSGSANASSGSASASGGSGGAEETGQLVQPEITSRHVVIPVEGHTGETVEVRAGNEYLFTATVGRGGEVQVSRGSGIAEELERAVDRKATIAVHTA